LKRYNRKEQKGGFVMASKKRSEMKVKPSQKQKTHSCPGTRMLTPEELEFLRKESKASFELLMKISGRRVPMV